MPHPLESGTVRCFHSDGATKGTGFLVSDRLVVTCAHVIQTSDGTVQVQFVGQDKMISARVLPEYYRDPDHGDIAFLLLESTPENIIPLPLGDSRHSLSGSPFRAFGYPVIGNIMGIHARGEILGKVAENDQVLLQLRSSELNLGHSGAPVWDEKRNVVVGMVVSVFKTDASGKLRDTAFAIPSESLWQVCPEIQPSEISPYLGLNAFSEETAQFFFGRDTLVEKLINVLRGGCRFLAVFGPSGCGKSSVVRAGLLPALEKGQLPESQKWAQVKMRPADDPFMQMKNAGLNPIDVKEYLKSHPGMERMVLFIDQFEELFTLCPDDIRERFTRELALALEDPKLILILSMRDDFYSAFHSAASPLAESKFLRVENVPGVLTQDELMAMIERPAGVVGAAVEPGLGELIIKDLTHDGSVRSSSLPLLEFALTQLWIKRREGRLTHDAYREIGGVTGSLARWANDAYSELSETHRRVAEDLLTSLVHLGDESQGLPDTRRRRQIAELSASESQQHVMKHLADRRLIVADGNTVELIHDALLSEWDELKRWIRDNRHNLRLREKLADLSSQWEASGRKDVSLLYKGWRLREVVALSGKFTFTVLEQDFIAASIRAERRQRLHQIGTVLAYTALFIVIIVLGPGRWAYYEYLRQKVIRESPLAHLEGGEIIFGTDSSTRFEDEPALEKRKVDSFSIETMEVTNVHYRVCVEVDVCDEPKDTEFYDQRRFDLHPVVHVTLEQAETYCAWLGRRLPDTYEWELAARGRDGRPWPWDGDEFPTVNHANVILLLDSASNEWYAPTGTEQVGSYPLGRTPEGVYDLLGNVWEWTTTPMETAYIQRGGAWDSVMYRITNIRVSVDKQPDSAVGFRCAR
ncbi:MAG: SUMF1/EgtB/PvdO family nonheme iron enzyme [Chloroflexi bacterium]|nr:SUMF1/EgtB/PvdO family nonheme iron enzyme [Chloroflexota bacterium]